MGVPPEERLGHQETILCPTCNSHNMHTVKGAYNSKWGDDDVWGGAEHDLLACNGCQTGTYRITAWCSEDYQDGPSTTMYPARGGPVDPRLSRAPKDYDYLPFGSPLESVYRQTVAAFNAQLCTLTGAGVRLLIEGICIERAISGGEVTDKKGKTSRKKNLEGKINGLVEQGFISKQQAAHLHEIRSLGNDAAHELDQPSIRSLAIALDIVEHVLHQVYEQPELAKTLAARKRPMKKSAGDPATTGSD